MLITAHKLVIFLLFIECSLGRRISNLIPSYCDQNIESKPLKEVSLSDSGNDSFLTVGANILQGTQVVANYKCYLVVSSPANRGMILTLRKAALNNNDTITFRSGSNPDRVWGRHFGSSKVDENEYEEIISHPSNSKSTMNIKYELTPGKSPFNAGFDIAITVYKVKEESCGTDFDCLNKRCISSTLQCDGYNNCGNNYDELGCSSSNWWIVAILIPIAIIVLLLAVLVWIRMSRG